MRFLAAVHRIIFKLCICCHVFAIQLGDSLPLTHFIPLSLYPPTIGYWSRRPSRMLCPSLSQCYQVNFCHAFGSKIIYPESPSPSPVYPSSYTAPVLVLLFWSIVIILLLFRVTDEGLIIALLWQVCSCRPQHIIQDSDWEHIQYLGTHMPQWWVSLFSTVGLHHWSLIGKFHECSTSNPLFIYRWNVLLYLTDHHHYWWFLSCLLIVYIND